MAGKQFAVAVILCVALVGGAVIYITSGELFEGRVSSDPVSGSVRDVSSKVVLDPSDREQNNVLKSEIGSGSNSHQSSAASGRNGTQKPAITITRLKSPGKDIEALIAEARKDWEVYKSYPIPVLESLGEAGDLVALRALTDIYYDKGNFERVKSTLRKAVLFGADSAYMYMGSQLIFEADFESDRAGGYDKSSRETLLEGFSWLMFGAIVGKPRAEKWMTGELRDNEVMLSPEEWELVKQKAIALHERLSKERKALGLEPFDVVVK